MYEVSGGVADFVQIRRTGIVQMRRTGIVNSVPTTS